MGPATPRYFSAASLWMERSALSREHLDGLGGGQLHRVDAGDGGQRRGGDADRAEHGGDAVGDQAAQDGGDGREAQRHKHRRRDGDGGAEAGHALEEAAEAPADEQRQDAPVGRDAAQHALDRVHRAGVDRQVVGEDGRDDHDDDGPDRHGKALERRGGDVDRRHVPAEKCRADRDHERAQAGLVGLHVQATQGDDQPEDGR